MKRSFLGSLPAECVHSLVKESDIVLYPSLTESLGLPLLEAIMLEKVIIASDRPYAREILGEAAIYFDADDPQDIAQKIRDVLANTALQAEMVEKCAKRKNELLRTIQVQRADFLEYIFGECTTTNR